MSQVTLHISQHDIGIPVYAKPMSRGQQEQLRIQHNKFVEMRIHTGTAMAYIGRALACVD